MNPPSYPPSPVERSRDREELVKFYVLNEMTYKYLVSLGLRTEAEKFRQIMNLQSVASLTSLPVVDELLPHVTIQQQPPNIGMQLFPNLATTIINGSTTDTVIDTVPTVPNSIAPFLAPKRTIFGPISVNNNGTILGNTSIVRPTQLVPITMIPTPPGARAVTGNTSMSFFNPHLSPRFRSKIAAVVQNHTAIQGSTKRARYNTFVPAGCSTTTGPPTSAVSSGASANAVAGCSTDLCDITDISSLSTSDNVEGCTSDIQKLHI
ncbi:hypothetical protein ACH5RR_013381 [Cinchona calisaya]|uniref:LisH domain-containing protein n=1 Tax=Cinchona calisaya TaxID=153742 RepID=A0ABD2ZZY9_9GENT